VTSRHRHNSVE